jgi:DNA-binding protein H-NS
MPSYESLMAQAEALKKKALAQRDKKLKSVVADIQKKMAEWGISIEDLKGKVTRAKPIIVKSTRAPSANKGKKVAIKYRDGDKTWTGRGMAPKWLKEAEAAGKSRDTFLVK